MIKFLREQEDNVVHTPDGGRYLIGEPGDKIRIPETLEPRDFSEHTCRAFNVHMQYGDDEGYAPILIEEHKLMALTYY